MGEAQVTMSMGGAKWRFGPLGVHAARDNDETHVQDIKISEVFVSKRNL
jgi:hypothetical protein